MCRVHTNVHSYEGRAESQHFQMRDFRSIRNFRYKYGFMRILRPKINLSVNERFYDCCQEMHFRHNKRSFGINGDFFSPVEQVSRDI